MSAHTQPHVWSPEALLAKAQRYSEMMLSQERGTWTFGFWSALALEVLARAALANVSPVLLAENKDWNNLYYALGGSVGSANFSPRSASTSEVLKRLQVVLPSFTKENANFCTVHADRRNGELHSGNLSFDELRDSEWQPQFYIACKTLIESLNHSLDYLLGDEEAEIAVTMIASFRDAAAKSVLGQIDAFKAVWEAKDDAEMTLLSSQADTWASRHAGHRVNCPACGNNALLQGSPIGGASASLKDGIITEKQDYLPSNFECIACGLKIAGHSKLGAAGLGDAYVSTMTFDAVDYLDATYEGEWEPDYNDPF